VLRQSVGLVRWQAYADMTDDLFDRLSREAIIEARDAVSTSGYFSPPSTSSSTARRSR
jgi:hypothetical protein